MSDDRELHTTASFIENLLNEVYGGSRTMSLPPLLPGFERPATDALSLARSLLGYRDAYGAGLFDFWRAAGEFLASTSRGLHLEVCRHGVSPLAHEPSACRREVTVGQHLLLLLAGLCDYWSDSDTSEITRSCLLATYTSQSDVADALEAKLRLCVHPPWNSRQLIEVSSRFPTVHIGSPITNVDSDQYRATHSLTGQLRSVLERHDYLVETPGDFVSPENRDLVPTNEMITLTAIHRASLAIVFADGGGYGTAATWTMTAELGIPTLVLHSPTTNIHAARFNGKLFRRTVVPYGSPDEAVAAVGNFIAANATLARRRAGRIAGFRDVDISHLARAFGSIDPIAFDTSLVTWEQAHMYVGDPVNWFQARPEVRTEIIRVIGDLGVVGPSPDPTFAGAVADEPVPAGGGLIGLMTLAEEHGWPPEIIADAWDVLRTEVEVEGVSARPVSAMTYDAWMDLLRREGWDL